MAIYEIALFLCLVTSAGVECYHTVLPEDFKPERKEECRAIAADLDRTMAAGGKLWAGEAACRERPRTV